MTEEQSTFTMESRPSATRKAVIFACVVAIWLALDLATKWVFRDLLPGGILAGPFLGLVDIRLVHNTGAAWGIFSDSTFALGVFSVVVCVALTAYFYATIRDANTAETIGFGLVVAGGIGNALDRFFQGYVIDFIEFSFIDFPVFNVADIGVTCGFVIIIIGLLASMRKPADKDE